MSAVRRPLPIGAAWLLLGAAALAAVTALPGSPVRALLALPLALLLPGAALVRICPERGAVDRSVRAGLAVVLSLAVYPLLALALYAAGVRLTTSHVVLATDGLVVALAVAPRLRRTSEFASQSWKGAVKPALLLGLAIAALGAVLWGSLQLMPVQTPPVRFLDIQLVGGWAKADGVRTVPGGMYTPVPVSIANHTSRGLAVALRVGVDGGRALPGLSVRVRPGDSEQVWVVVEVPPDGRVHRVWVRASGVPGPLTVWLRGARKGRR